MTVMKDFKIAQRWIPAILVMGVIFFFSSLPSNEVPEFGVLDTIIKKTGHALGYAILSVAYFFALPSEWQMRKRFFVSLALTMLYATSDEFHQSFVAGRSSSLLDVLIDMSGALVGLMGYRRYSSNSNSSSAS